MNEFLEDDHISVDCVIFGFDFENLNVLLVERTLFDDNNEIVFSDLTLTGNHIYRHEDLDDAAKRVLYNLTGLDNIYMEQFFTFYHPDRLKSKNDVLWLKSIGKNPDSRVITVAYFSMLNKSKIKLVKKERNVAWYPVNEVTELAYDHKLILDKALESLRLKLAHDPIAFELLPTKFSISQLQRVYEVIMNDKYDRRNFRRKVLRMKYLIELKEKQTDVKHIPAKLYMFSKDVYDVVKSDYINSLI
jgi:8-oxo-dGTP diphosphatase